jgi:hypothetical protein
MMQGVVLLSAASRTLIVSDLCEQFGPWSPRPTRLLAQLANR